MFCKKTGIFCRFFYKNRHYRPVFVNSFFQARIHYLCIMILMGVVNLTPDSFRAETRAMSPAAVRRRVKALLGRGCGIIDFGAVSTRPSAADVPVEEEWARLEPTLALVETAGVPSPTASLRFAPIGVSDSGVPEN
ncbi:MAG: dihydropteroate synthase, partial [Bacteroidales bacterium]|nr:dihydropteroate synthase [Bacteroidales bacterium]